MRKVVKTFPRDYSAAELDEGVEMTYHPVTRCLLADLQFDRSRGVYYYDGGSAWWYYKRDLPRIGDGHSRFAGDNYPTHWRFDPFTGDML